MLKMPHPKTVIAGVDFGYINPSVILVIFIDNDDNFYVIDELYLSGLTISELVSKGLRLKEKHKIEIFFADPSQPAYIREMNNSGLYTLAAKNEILPGINAVCEKLKIREDGRPALLINKRCKNLIFELENYRYAGKDGGKGAFTEIPEKKDDHACDALRYAIYSMKKMFKPKSFKPRWL
jgi:phage terminase large subunit